MSEFELPDKVHEWAGVLRSLYASEGESEKLEVVSTAKLRVDEDAEYDNWNDGAHVHHLYLTIPIDVFVKVIRTKTELQNELSKDFNSVHNVANEYLSVFLENDGSSVALPVHRAGQVASQEDRSRDEKIWGSGFRVFLSHKAEYKASVFSLKEDLAQYGVASFVAHADITPTEEWQGEIERALASMDCLVALMTQDFHDSDWTDQEVGFAVCRRVPIIPVRLGLDPYGFIGKFQALSCEWSKIAENLVKILIKIPRMVDCFLGAFEECDSYEQGKTLARVLPLVEDLSDEQVVRFISAFNANSQVYGCYKLQSDTPSFLRRITGRRFRVDRDGWNRSELVEISR